MLTFPAGRRAKFFVLLAALLVAGGIGGTFASKFEKAQKNETSSFLPGDTESVQALDAVKRFPGGETAAAVTVVSKDSRLTPGELARVKAVVADLNQNRPRDTLESQGPIPSANGRAALIITPVQATADSGDSQRFLDTVDDIRTRAHALRGDGREVEVTGAAGFGADAVKVFSNSNGQWLFAAGGLVLILLILIYRSPIFWTIPFFTVLFAETTARGFGYLLAKAGVTINGQSGGILPVLVFGAGTDYALLLVSRYREELRRHDSKHEAMRVALRNAGPAILASGLTVIVALLTLTLAEVNATAGLGPVGAMGVFLAMVSMLTMLPALLVVCGRRAFWSPFLDTIPHVGDPGTDETHGAWRRIGERVARRPRRIWVAGTVVLILLALNVTQIDTGLTNGNSFRGSVESVQGANILARSFPGGLSAPTNVIVPDAARAAAVRAALLKRRDLVATVLPPQQGPPGTRLDVILRRDPFSTAAFEETPALRRIARAAGGPNVLVGGPTAESYDYRKSATRDNYVILPLALLVVLLILAGLLRALLAPVLLVASVILSFFAALGTGIFFFNNVFGFAGVDPSLPLLAFVFLVALGIDYNIFLMARVREETLRHGTRGGMLRGLAVTGAVITSAGIVLAGPFSALAVLPLVFLTEIGFIIAFGVLLDTFLVRSVLVPALAFDLGPRIWWPSRLARTDGVRESAGSARAPTAGPARGTPPPRGA